MRIWVIVTIVGPAMFACLAAGVFLMLFALVYAPPWARGAFGAWCAFYLARQLADWIGRKVDEEKRALESYGGNTV